MTSDWWHGFLIGTILPVLGLVVTLWRFILERREKISEREEKLTQRAAKQKAEEQADLARAVLAAAESRADAPFVIPSPERTGWYTSGSDTAWNAMNGNVLSPLQEVVSAKIPAGTPIVLPLANMGDSPRWVGFKLNGVKIESVRYTDGTPELWGIVQYPFDPSMNGKGQVVEVHFESSRGVSRMHRYGMQHGVFKFGRLDPQPSTDSW